MAREPTRKRFIAVFTSQFIQDACVTGDVWQERGDVTDEASESSNIGGRFWYRPLQDAVYFVVVGFDPPGGDVVPKEINFGTE